MDPHPHRWTLDLSGQVGQRSMEDLASDYRRDIRPYRVHQRNKRSDSEHDARDRLKRVETLLAPLNPILELGALGGGLAGLEGSLAGVKVIVSHNGLLALSGSGTPLWGGLVKRTCVRPENQNRHFL